MIPVAFYFPGAGVDVLAIGALLTSAACVLFPQAQRGNVCKATNAHFFRIVVCHLLAPLFRANYSSCKFREYK